MLHVIFATAVSLAAVEEYELPALESDVVEDTPAVLSSSFQLMTTRRASHFAVAQGALSGFMADAAESLAQSFGAMRFSATQPQVTTDGKGWDMNFRAEPLLVDARNATRDKCIAMIGEIKASLGYLMNGTANGSLADVDGLIGGAVAVAHYNALDLSLPANNIAAALAQAEAIRKKSWIRLTMPYQQGGVVNELECRNKINKSNVQVSY